jgi:hypothetical protein
MKKNLFFTSLFILATNALNAQTFEWTTNDSVVENLTQNSTAMFPLHQKAIGNDTIVLAVEIIYNDIPSAWDGMVCIYGTCFGSIPVVGTTAQMDPIYGSNEGMVRLTVNPFSGTEMAKLQVYVYDTAFPNDGDTATFILNPTLGVSEASHLTNSLRAYPNPANTLIQVTAATRMTVIEVYDLAGKCVHQQQVNKFSSLLNIEELVAGAYVLRVVDNNGLVITKKVIKE